MAKKRWVDTKFWSDSWVRTKLNPLDRYLFLYFLTNEHTTICGIYELPINTIAYETGIDENDLRRSLLPRLKPKVFFFKNWLILPNFIKHQNIKSPKVITGIKDDFTKVPAEIKSKAIEYGYSIDTISHLDSDLDLDSDLNNTLPVGRGAKKKQMKRLSFHHPYREDQSSDSFEDIIDSDSNQVVVGKKSNVSDVMEGLLKWAAERRGGKFMNLGKQFKAMALLRKAEIPPAEVKNRWVEFERDSFWQKKGFDFMDIVNSFDKRPLKK